MAEPSDSRKKRGGFRPGWVLQDVAGLGIRLSAVEREREQRETRDAGDVTAGHGR